MVRYCGKGRRAWPTVPVKPGKTAALFAGSGAPTLAAKARSEALTSESGRLSISLPSLSALKGMAFRRSKFDRRRVARWPM
jgi:hypothetical protein